MEEKDLLDYISHAIASINRVVNDAYFRGNDANI